MHCPRSHEPYHLIFAWQLALGTYNYAVFRRGLSLSTQIVKKCLMAVVGMEREEAEIVRAFLEYPCLVPAEFEQDVGLTLHHWSALMDTDMHT